MLVYQRVNMGIPLNQPVSSDFPLIYHFWGTPIYGKPHLPTFTRWHGDCPRPFQSWGQQRVEGVERGDALRDGVVGVADAHDLTPWRSTAYIVLHVNQFIHKSICILWIYIYVHIYIHTYIYTYIYTYEIYIYIYICIWRFVKMSVPGFVDKSQFHACRLMFAFKKHDLPWWRENVEILRYLWKSF